MHSPNWIDVTFGMVTSILAIVIWKRARRSKAPRAETSYSQSMGQVVNQDTKTFVDRCTAVADALDGSRFIVKLRNQLKVEDDDTTQMRQSIAPKVVELAIAMCRESIQLLNLNLSLNQEAPLGSTIITRATLERAAKAFHLIEKDESAVELLGRTLNEILIYRYHEWDHSRQTSSEEFTQDTEYVKRIWDAYVLWAEMAKRCRIGVELVNDPNNMQMSGPQAPKGWAKLLLENSGGNFIEKIEKLLSRVNNGALGKPMYNHLSSVAHYNMTSLLEFDRITLDANYETTLSAVMVQPSAEALDKSEHWFLWSCVGVYSVLCEILEQFEPENFKQDLLSLQGSFDPVFSLLFNSEMEMRSSFDDRTK